MVKIEKISWGKAKVNGQVYHQVLIVGEKVLPRDQEKLEKLFGTTHQIADWEQKELLSGHPDVILIANGWNGILKVNPKFKVQISKLGIELRVVSTGRVRREYQNLMEEGKKVNCLIHTTC